MSTALPAFTTPHHNTIQHPQIHMQTFDEEFLANQMEIVQRERHARGQEQLAQWKHAAGPGSLVDPKLRFVALLEEGCRHEVNAIRNNTASRPHAVSDPDLLINDIKSSYGKLIPEARRLFDERREHLSLEELTAVSTQATSSFASMYPWSDGVTCRDLTISHRHFVPLATHNMITAGTSGVVTIKSFIASMPCAEMKQEAALARRQARIDQYFRERDEAAAAVLKAATTAASNAIHHESNITLSAEDPSIAWQQPKAFKQDAMTPCSTATPRVKSGRIAGASCSVNNRSPGRRNRTSASRRPDRVHISL